MDSTNTSSSGNGQRDLAVLAALAKLQAAMNNPASVPGALEAARVALERAIPQDSPEAMALSSYIAQASGTAPSGCSGGVDASKLAYPPTSENDVRVAQSFSTSERNYYESFNPNAQYEIQARNPDGSLNPNAPTQKVTGEKIRTAITTTKDYAISDDKPQKVAEEMKATGGKSETLDKLSDSLDTLEQRRAVELTSQGKSNEVRRMSATFKKAKENIKAVKDAASSLIAQKKSDLPGANDALVNDHLRDKALEAGSSIRLENALTTANNTLRKTLQTDILQDTMGLVPDRFQNQTVIKAATYAASPGTALTDLVSHYLQ